MDDKKFDRVIAISALIIAVWWILQPKQPTTQIAPAVDMGIPSPELAAFSANPGAFMPQNLGSINVNIGNQGLGFLSNQYIPLFGFVGMAQGAFYQ